MRKIEIEKHKNHSIVIRGNEYSIFWSRGKEILDFDATEFLYGLLLQYKEEGSILMSSHIAESIVRVCDTAYTIEDGHLDAIESNLEDWFHDVNRQRG